MDLCYIPAGMNSDGLFTEEKGLIVLNLEIMMLPLTVDTVILEHIGLHPKNKLKKKNTIP